MTNRAFKGKYNIIYPLSSIESWKDFFFVTLDTESYRHKVNNGDVVETQNLAICDIYDGTSHKLLYNVLQIEEYVKELSTKHDNLIVFAHNFFYDSKITGLLERILIDGEYADLPVKTKLLDTIFYVKLSNVTRTHRKNSTTGNLKEKDERTVEFIDSYNFFKAPLRDLLHSFNAEKYASEKDYKMDSETWNAWLDDGNKENLVQSDTEGLYEYLQKGLSLIPKSISAPSSVFKLYRHEYLKDNISIPKYVNDFAELAYRGGRVEAYLLTARGRNVNYYDFNSLYPYVMKKYKYAYRYDKETTLSINELYNYVKNQEFDYLLQIDYTLPKGTRRSPIMVKRNDKLSQMLAALGIWVVGIELCDLIDSGAVVVIKKQFQFNVKDLFSQYVDDFYALKKNAKNEIEKNVYKLYLNSFYGKFGQHRRVSEFISINKLDVAWKPIIALAKKEGNKKITLKNEEGKRMTVSIYGDFISYMIPMEITYNSMIAAEVTAYARHENWLMQKEIGIENVLYTDTDSFITDKEHAIGKELGELKLEYKGLCKIYNPKHYTITDADGKVIKDSEKGIPKRAERLEDGSIEFTSFGKVKDGYLSIVAIHEKRKKKEIESDKLRYVAINKYEKEGLPYD